MAKRRAIDDVLAPVTDDPAPTPTPPSVARPARPTAKRGSAKRSPRTRRAAPAQQAPPVEITGQEEAERDKRLNVPLTAGELRALQAARLDDGVPAAARVRAMIRLWQSSQQVREQVDSTAQRGH